MAPLVAAIASLSAVLQPAWQREGATVGGTATGACLVLAALALSIHAFERPTRARLCAVAILVGLSCGYEPLVGLTAFAAVVLFAASSRSHRTVLARTSRADLRAMVAFGVMSATPWVVALTRMRTSGAPLVPGLLADWAGERGASAGGSLLHLASGSVGAVGAAMAGAGAAIGLAVPAARPVALSLSALVVLGSGAAAIGAPVGPTRVGAPLLLAIGGSWALAGVGLLAVVRLVDRARVPLARWAACMVLLLELVLPVEAADGWLALRRPRTGAWDNLVWGRLPAGAVVLLSTPRVYARAQAARASGSFPEGVTLVPTFSGGAPPSPSVLSDPSWRHLWRDLALDGKPSEPSLAALADRSPLEMGFDPAWDHALARHLVPDGLLDRYTPEPRGASDRLRALEAFRPVRDELSLLAAHDPDLAEATIACLRARISGYLASGERDLALRAVDDARAIAPSDSGVARWAEWARTGGGPTEHTRGH